MSLKMKYYRKAYSCFLKQEFYALVLGFIWKFHKALPYALVVWAEEPRDFGHYLCRGIKPGVNPDTFWSRLPLSYSDALLAMKNFTNQS